MNVRFLIGFFDLLAVAHVVKVGGFIDKFVNHLGEMLDGAAGAALSNNYKIERFIIQICTGRSTGEQSTRIIVSA